METGTYQSYFCITHHWYDVLFWSKDHTYCGGTFFIKLFINIIYMKWSKVFLMCINCLFSWFLQVTFPFSIQSWAGNMCAYFSRNNRNSRSLAECGVREMLLYWFILWVVPILVLLTSETSLSLYFHVAWIGRVCLHIIVEYWHSTCRSSSRGNVL